MSLQDIGSEKLQDTVDVEHLPEQGRQFPDPPQPGTYRFALSPLGDENFIEVASQKGKRVQVRFNEDAPLVIVQSPGGTKNGETFETSMSNITRERGKKGSGVEASDWDYLNKALKETGPRPASNKEFGTRLMAKAAAKTEFAADIEWSWRCSATRDAYFAAADGSTQTVPETDPATGQPTGRNVPGCGKKLYQKDVPKVNGVYPARITCPDCQASVRAFGNLTRIRE
jgi:hypothetical protein